MARKAVLALTAVLIFVIGVLPVLSMLVQSVTVAGHFSLTALSGVLSSGRQWTLLRNSLELASLVSLLCVALGVPMGIVLGKTDLPLKRLFASLFLVPLLIPPYIVAVSWSDLLGSGGLATRLPPGFPVGAATRFLFGLPGCVLVLFSVFLPVPMLMTMIFLRTVDPRLEEAGRLVTGWWGVLRGITLPSIVPGILLSAMLVFILSLGEFSVPAFLRYEVFPVESFTRFAAFYDFRSATAAALPLAGIALLLLFVEAEFLRERTREIKPFPEVERLPGIDLGRYRNGVVCVLAAAGLLLVVLPIGGLLARSSGPHVYLDALNRAGGSLMRSLAYAGTAATLLAMLGLMTGYLVHTRALACWRLVDSATVFLLALSSPVVGIGLIRLWNTPMTDFIYGTPAIIILGYLAKYTALTSRISVAQLARIPASMEEAAQVAGAGWFRRMVFIVTPLARRGLVGGWLVGFIFSLRDTGITMLVYPAGHETLPVRIFTLMANGSPPLIAALCVMMIVITLVPAGLIWSLSGLGKGRGVGWMS